MKRGLFFSQTKSSSIFQQLQKLLSLTLVSSAEELKTALHAEVCDFIYLDIKNEQDVWSLLHTVFKMDAELVLVTHHVYGLPFIRQLHQISEQRIAESLLEVLSFEEARSQHQLQVVYSGIEDRGRDQFYLTEQSPMGIVMTDSEGSIFYINEAGKELLNYDEGRKLLRQHLQLDRRVDALNHENSQRGIRSYDQVAVVDSDRFVSLILKDVTQGDERIGSVAFFEDVTDAQLSSARLSREKDKYEKLTSRLNDLILKGVDTDIYNESYIARKLDLEIRHAHRMQNDCGVCVFFLKDYEDLFQGVAQQKNFQVRVADAMMLKFPDPYIVGFLTGGFWIVIAPTKISDNDLELNKFQQELNLILQDESHLKTTKFRQVIFNDLRQFQSSDDMVEVLKD